MSHRITIMLDSKIAIKLRKRQSDEIKNTSNNVSFSKIINRVSEIGLKRVEE